MRHRVYIALAVTGAVIALLGVVAVVVPLSATAAAS